jgi:hypothetical protein
MTIGVLAQFVDWWSSYYSDHQAVSVTIRYLHLAALVVGGGAALTIDRSLWRAARRRLSGERAIESLNTSHRMVLAGLAVIASTGTLMALADMDTYSVSALFWTKLGLVALLLGNGALLARAGKRARVSGASVPRAIGIFSAVSIVLWLSIAYVSSWLMVAA